MRVTTPSGEEWYVRRRWATRMAGRESLGQRFRRRMRSVRRGTAEHAEVDPGCAPDLGEGIAVAILAG